MVSLLLVSLLSSSLVIPEPIPEGERLLHGELPRALDGRFRLTYLLGRTEPLDETGGHWFLGHAVDGTSVAVTLRLARTPKADDVQAVEKVGCRLDRLPSGALANVGPFTSGRCEWRSLFRLAASPLVLRVEPNATPRAPSPVAPPPSTVAGEVQVQALRQASPGLNAGKGVVIADLDSGFDPFHPFLFRADGGAFAWLDVDGNRAFEPNVDAVDFNRNGQADPGETLRVLKAPVIDLTRVGKQNTGAFLPGVDWLFQDENADGLRNFGAQPPYGDAKPTYGEQLFVADDVNQNGVLELGERLVALKTPKVKVALGFPAGASLSTAPDVEYFRDVNLASLLERYPDPSFASHGTLIAGTLVGGTPGLTRYAGIAPDADLVMATRTGTNQIPVLAWSLSQGATVVNWELAQFHNEYLDGSSNLELACDEATKGGSLQVATAGNLGALGRLRVKTESGTSMAGIAVPGAFTGAVLLSLTWRGPADALAFNVGVGTDAIDVIGTSGTAVVGDLLLRFGRATSAKGTQIVSMVISATAGQRISAQTLRLGITATGAPVELHGFAFDQVNPWGPGVKWTADTTDDGSYGSPATSDTTLAVGSYRLDSLLPGQPKGGLAAHSSRGPRIDGAEGIDLCAPEDLVSSWRDASNAIGTMAYGSGTSNSTPVVAGAAAVLSAMDPTLGPAQLAQALRGAAEKDALTAPSNAWGAGRLRAFRAAMQREPQASEPPVARGTATRMGAVLRLDARASTDPEGGALTFAWDVGYDGTVDLEANGEVVRSLPSEAQVAVLEVRDPEGNASRVVVPVVEAPVEVVDAGPPFDAGTMVQEGDAGITGQPAAPERGCGCSGAPGSVVAVLVMLLRKRRR